MMAKYKFAAQDVTYQEGYTIVIVRDGLADINENDLYQVALAKKHGGVELVQKKETTKRGNK